MSSNLWSWKHKHWFPAREYYLSATVTETTPDQYTGFAIGNAIVCGLVAASIFLGLYQGDSILTAWLWCGAILAILWALFVAVSCSMLREHMQDLLRIDDNEGRKRREPIAKRIKYFAERQDEYRGLMNMDQAKIHQWVIDSGGYYNIRDDWPQDFHVYAELKSEPYYGAAVMDLYPQSDKETPPFELIMDKRRRISEWALRETTPEERGKATVARNLAIQEDVQLAKLRLQQLAKQAQPLQPNPLED
jgi:hypothetical protein